MRLITREYDRNRIKWSEILFIHLIVVAMPRASTWQVQCVLENLVKKTIILITFLQNYDIINKYETFLIV